MRLEELLTGIEGLEALGEQGPTEGPVEVTHLALDSRRVRPGSLFVALRGAAADGHDYLDAARERGAAALVVERPPEEATGLPTYQSADARDLVARLTWRLRAPDLGGLRCFGVTGTKGKTTTTRMLASILNSAGIPCGSVGTLGWVDREGRGEPLANTTPDPARLGEIVENLCASGHQALTLEASSQAGVQARLRYLPLEGLAFLNLSPEHAELHPTMESYRDAKARLFEDAAAARPDLLVVVPEGDPDGEEMVRRSGPGARVLRFGEGEGADCRGRILDAGLEHLALEITWRGESHRVRLGFGGLFNIENALAAATLALGSGVSPEAVVAGLEALEPVRGRFQVLSHRGVSAMVDYAHSANALERLLESCRPLVPEGRLLLVFGCGGKKDPRKRPRMGASAAAYADRVWITNDNPRGEDPEAIARDILAGIPAGARERARIELDRRRAIRAALGEASGGDLVVVAGKGHETAQDLGDRVIEFDDLEEIRSYWAKE